MRTIKRFASRQQVQFAQQADKAFGAAALVFKVRAELHGVLDVRRGLAAFEERHVGVRLGHHGGAGIDAQDHTLLAFVIGEDERIAAGEGRQVAVGLEDAFGRHEYVLTG